MELDSVQKRLQTDRFQIEDEIGRGASGVVFRAFDRELRQHVALKVLLEPRPEDLYRLKREFRFVADVAHPNLVRLHELVVSEPLSYLSMELIEGSDFLRALRPAVVNGGADGLRRLRRAVQELALAVNAIHGAGLLHRDLKPSNVLLEDSGRVVVLDFGLSSFRGEGRRDASLAGGLTGTLGYVAPEEVWGGEVGEAADWYSVGVILFEVLTGKRPHDNAPSSSERPPRASQLAPGLPEDLDGVTASLLEPEPAARPRARQILQALGPEAPRDLEELDPEAGARELLGRESELSQLEEAFARSRAGRFALLEVQGEPGIGKTVLVERFLASLPEDVLALRGRCHPAERVPYKSLDPIMDELTGVLAWADEDEREGMMPRHAGDLARLFPVFGRVPGAFEGAAATRPEADPGESRRRAFRALEELLARMCRSRQVVVWIDDFQWSDPDGARLLEELVSSADPPPLLLVLSYRPEQGEPVRAAERLGAREDARRVIALRPLPEAELDRLIAGVLGEAAEGGSIASTVRRECAGNPFLATELARANRTVGRAASRAEAAPLDLAGALRLRTRQVDDPARRLLNALAVAGHPLSEEVVRLFSGAPEAASLLQDLTRRGLIRRARLGEGVGYCTFHDCIGESLRDGLPEPVRRDLCLEIATALESSSTPDPHHLVRLYEQSGDTDRAGRFAYRSAEYAERDLAFHLAAELYARALALGYDELPRWILLERRAEALLFGGLSPEAGHEFLRARDEASADGAEPTEVLRLGRRAAETLMRCGLRDEGMPLIRALLQESRLRWCKTPTSALARLVVGRAHLRATRALGRTRARELDAAERERLDICWSTGIALSNFDAIRAAELQVRHALLAQASTDVGHRARALATEGLVLAWEGGRRKRREAGVLLAEGRRLAERSGDPHVEAHALVMSAVRAFYERRLAESYDLARRAEQLCRTRCRDSGWEMANLQTIIANILSYRGEFAGLGAQMRELLRDCRLRGDRYMGVMLALGMPNLHWLAEDDPEEARSQLRSAIPSADLRSAWQIYQESYADVQIDLYTGCVAEARAGLERAWRELERERLFRFQPVRAELLELRARVALAVMAHEPDGPSAEDARAVTRDLRRLRREDAAWVAPFADALSGLLATARGDREQGSADLHRAAVELERLDLRLHATAARLRVGQLRGETREVERGVEWLSERGVKRPLRLAQMLQPLPAAQFSTE